MYALTTIAKGVSQIQAKSQINPVCPPAISALDLDGCNRMGPVVNHTIIATGKKDGCFPGTDHFPGKIQKKEKPQEQIGGSSYQKTDVRAKLMGSSVSGVLELCLFHGLDTIRKRFQNNPESMAGDSLRDRLGNMKAVAFQGASTPMDRAQSLYRGFVPALGFKVPQRVLVFTTQRSVKEQLEEYSQLDEAVGTSYAGNIRSAVAGSVAGLVEATALLPIDALKIRLQTDAKASAYQVIKNEGVASLYNSYGITCARNCLGSASWFLFADVARQHVFQTKPDEKPPLSQYMAESAVGSFFRLGVSNPFDVVRVRLIAEGNTQKSSMSIAKEVMHEEGARGFYKGFGMSLVTVGPKLMFSLTLGHYLMDYFQKSTLK